MLSPLTKREIKGVGYGRYIRENNRYWWTIGILYSCFIIAIVVSFTTEHILSKWVSTPIVIWLTLVGVLPLFKLVFYDAEKAGKHFLVEWEKEHGTIQEEAKH